LGSNLPIGDTMTKYTIPKVGRAISSSDWYRYIGAFAVDYVDYGFQVTHAGNLIVSVSAGRVYIQGIALESDSTEELTMQANTTNHIFIRLLKDIQGRPLDWSFVINTTGSKPIDSIKIAEVTTNSSTVVSIIDRRALGDLTYMFIGSYATLEPRAGLVVSDPELRYLMVRDSSNTRWIPLLGSKGNDYPFLSLYEARDHFNRENVNVTGAPQLYVTSLASIENGNNDATARLHAITIGGNIANNSYSFFRTNYTVRASVQDAYRSIDRVSLDIRFRLITRGSNIRHALGLIDGSSNMDAFTANTRKICITVNGLDNFVARVSNGSESIVNTNTVSDTQWHILRIEWSTSNVRFFIDNVHVASITNNIPVSALNIFAAVYNATGATTTVLSTIDYWHYRII
jgi:hypothetical protein